ncbi:hypothetical protein BH09MYX1_BH09MYX1_21070 [soil metagenome]
MKQLLVQYTPSELDWSAEDLQLEEAPPSIRIVDAPPTAPSLPRFELDESDDSNEGSALTPLATPVLPPDAWPYDNFVASSPLETGAFAPVSHEESYVGALPQRDPREAVIARHVDLARSVSALESICERFDSVDMSARAAENSLRRRVGALAMVRRGLTDLIELTDEPQYAGVISDEGEAAPYLAGVYLWLSDIAEALTILAHQLNDLTPQWGDLRSRLDEVSWIYDMLIAEQMKLDGNLDRNDEALCAVFEDIFVAVVSFKVRLAEPFG